MTARGQVSTLATPGRPRPRLAAATLLVLLALTALLAPTSALALTVTVTSTGDQPDAAPGDGVCATSFGTCTLRAAIQEVNASAQADNDIRFALPGDGVQVISPTSALPTLLARTFVDGASQPGYAGAPLVAIDGLQAGAANGLVLGITGSRAHALAVYRFELYGVILMGSTLTGSVIGADASGTISRPNRRAGVLAYQNSTIGSAAGATTPCTGDCNVISGNFRDGLELSGSGITIVGNVIGLRRDGLTPLPNGRYGVRVPTVLGPALQNVTIGTAAAPNRLGHNGVSGVQIEGSDASSPQRITVRYNTFVANAAQAIALGGTTPRLNDPGDADVGPNAGLNTPVITSATLDASCSLTVSGFSRPGTRVDVYVADVAGRPSQGLRFLATATEGSAQDLDATTGSYSDPVAGADTTARFRFVFPAQGLPSPGLVTAIATDTLGNTSEFGPGVAADLGALAGDPDDDGLPSSIECLLGTDPLDPDSDGDGLLDGEEVGPYPLVAPWDSDGDGVIDALDPDDDGDGLPTAVELELSTPTSDRDGDGLPDYRDPDADGDGLLDGLEGVDDLDGDGWPNFLDPDSDGDGLCDTPLVPLGAGTIPADACVDGEDLNANGVRDPGETDPYDFDTDGDGLCDALPGTPGCGQTIGDNCPLVPNPGQEMTGPGPSGDACTCTTGCRTCFADLDGDGFTGTAVDVDPAQTCASVVINGRPLSETDDGDCDDLNPAAWPGAQEICDGVDNSCNGLVDSEDDAVAFGDPAVTGAWPHLVWFDRDGDLCGDPDAPRYACSPTDPGVADNDIDLDDTDGVCCGNGIVEPGEHCDGTDLFLACPAVTVGVPLCNNDPFNPNGDGTCTYNDPPDGCAPGRICYADLDGDGFRGTQRVILETQTCASFASGPLNLPWADTSDGDCRDNPADPCAPTTWPGAPEFCDGCDNDCDPLTPDGSSEPGYDDACDGDDRDWCDNGTVLCDSLAGQLFCFEIMPGNYEICDDEGVDEDCDGLVNDEDPDVAAFPDLSGAVLWGRDADEDGCGDPSVTFLGCLPPDDGFAWVDNVLDQSDQDGICCGNGVVEGEEQCDGDSDLTCLDFPDLAQTTEPVPCNERCLWDTSVCALPTCGNGLLEPPLETCEPGLDPFIDCRADCTYCGDAVVNGPETCEPGLDPAIDCRGDCTYCGDGNVDPQHSEECDHDGTPDDPDCPYGLASCQVCVDGCQLVEGNASFCGDGVVDRDNNEECEPGESADAIYCDDDGRCGRCLSTCRFAESDTPDGPVCGNGILEPGEQCDDGNTVSGDGCSAICRVETAAPSGCGCGVQGDLAGGSSGRDAGLVLLAALLLLLHRRRRGLTPRASMTNPNP